MTLRIYTPQLTPLFDSLYVCGPHNAWSINDAASRLVLVSEGVYEWTTPATDEEFFTFTISRGSLDRLESNAAGDSIAPHEVMIANGETVEIAVEGWRDLHGEHTVTPQVRLLVSRFPSPNGARRIWACLPKDYSTTTNVFYNAWYVQDGQNIFDRSTSFVGEWKWDEAMQEHCAPGIIIGIDNAGRQRLNEYAPFVNDEYKTGGGANAYIEWITGELMPFVNSRLRIKTGAENTVIAGSSMGALVSIWAVLRYPAYFGKAVAMSPSLWFNADDLLHYVHDNPISTELQLFMMGGVAESGHMITDMVDLQNALFAKGVDAARVAIYTDKDGAHSESSWSKQLPDALGWMDGCSIPVHNALPLCDVYAWPNPVRSTLNLALPERKPIRRWAIRNLDQREVMNNPNAHAAQIEVDCSALIPGAYQLLIVDENEKQYLLNIVKE